MSSWKIPSFTTRPNSFQNVANFSGSSVRMARMVSMIFLVAARRITWIWRFCCRISREMFRDRSSESTTPRTKRRYSGISSLQSCMMKTRRM